LKDVASLIKSKRIEKGFSLSSFAKELNVNYAKLYNLESGTVRNPSSAILYRICSKLEIDYNYILQLLGHDILTLNKEMLYRNNSSLFANS